MTKYVIVGGSAAGISCAEAIRETDKKGQITIISDEKNPLYSRCLLTYLIGGKIDREKLDFKDVDFYKNNNIKALHGIKATALNAKKKVVTLNNGKEISFDKLLIATGGSPKKLNIPGEEKKGVFGLRRIEQAESILAMLDNIDTAVILGGGLIGLRDAYALRLRGKKVKVVVRSPQILSQMLDKDAADMVEARLSKEGIEIIKGASAKEIIGKETVEGVLLNNGNKIPCQIIVIGKGVEPNLDIVKGSGIKINTGIKVNDHLETSEKDIFAAGDVAEAMDKTRNEARINAIWPVAAEQGKAAGLNMAGKDVIYDGSYMANSVDFFDLATISIGVTKPKDPSYEVLTFKDAKKSIYKKIVLKDNIICGLVLVNKVENAGVYGILIKKRVDVSKIKSLLLNDNFDYAKMLELIKEFPNSFKDKEFRESIITY